MNKKHIYILSLLLSLMVVLVFMQQLFSKDIKKVAMRNNGVFELSEYNLNEGELKVLLPKEWSIEERRENIDGKELEVEFNGDKLEGKVIILNNVDSISEVDKSLFQNINNKKYYRCEINSIPWNVLDFDVYENGSSFKKKCYFREFSEGKVILISFKYDDGRVKPSMEVVFEEIVDSLR